MTRRPDEPGTANIPKGRVPFALRSMRSGDMPAARNCLALEKQPRITRIHTESSSLKFGPPKTRRFGNSNSLIATGR